MLSWDAFLTRYRPMARAIAGSLCAAADADDVVQEAFLALLTAWRKDPARFEGPGHARNYLLRTVRNLAASEQRARARVRPLELEPPARDDETLRVLERQRYLAQLLEDLDGPERELVDRRFLRRETLAAISASTGIPVSTLHSRERALLVRLARKLDARDVEEGGLAS